MSLKINTDYISKGEKKSQSALKKRKGKKGGK
jgi:hypothetical protein